MAWTTPGTATAGEVLTAAFWNQNVRDNLNAPFGFGSTLPTSPTDGQYFNYQADAANGVIWTLRYNASSASAYKWEFIGGSPMSRVVMNQEGSVPLVANTWTDITTVMTVTTPVAGDYIIRASAQMQVQFASINAIGVANTAAGVPTTSTSTYISTNTQPATLAMNERRNAVPASTPLTMRFLTTNASASGFAWAKCLTVVPVRVA